MVEADRTKDAGEEKAGKLAGQQRLFRMPDTSATSIHHEKRLTCADRADLVADCIDGDPCEPWIVWCDTDYEADAVMERIPDAEEVRGSMQLAVKEDRLDAFSRGDLRVLVTKPSIAGYGLNWQHCARMAFVGLNDSYETYYQAIRRCYRYGQTRVVRAHVIVSELESQIAANVARKERDATHLTASLVSEMRAARKDAA